MKNMNNNIKKDNKLETAQEYIKIAQEHAKYKRTEGYNEKDFDMFEIINLNASLEVCNRGPADYYFEKAYDMLCSKYGRNHSEVHCLVDEIINYHVDNVKRMLAERFCLDGIIITVFIFCIVEEFYDKDWAGIIVYIVSYALYSLLWLIDLWLMCYMTKRHYRNIYK